MRIPVWLGAAALIALAGCQRQDAAAGADGPRAAAPARRPGLWSLSIINGAVRQAGRLCLDRDADRRLSWWGVQATPDVCAETQVTALGDGRWRFRAVCRLGSGGTVTTQGVASGDFAARYRLDGASTTVGAADATLNGERALGVDAAWLGPCPAGMAPGDMALPDGTKMNLLELHV